MVNEILDKVLGLLGRTEVLAALLVVNLVLVSSNIVVANQLYNANIDLAATSAQEQAQPMDQQPQQQLQLPIVSVSSDDDPVKGAESAPVTIVEFSDFECPFCTRFYQNSLPLIIENYVNTGKVKIVYRDFPLSFHANAQKAAEASECADDQGKFWEFHDILFERQSQWGSQGVSAFKNYASELGLNTASFGECLDSGAKAAEVQKDLQEGISYGVSGTPTFFVNGLKLVGAQPYEVFQAAIEQMLAG